MKCERPTATGSCTAAYAPVVDLESALSEAVNSHYQHPTRALFEQSGEVNTRILGSEP
jgi:hypothetical protein